MTAADLLFVNGTVWTGPGRPTAEALAVTGERITAVGGAEVLDLRGRGTQVVDLVGGMLVPGFQDAHIHPVQGGLERLSCDLSGVETEQEYVDVVRTYAEDHPGGGWITGGGWMLAAFDGGLPRKETLDAVVADRPVFLPNRDHHGGWVNSRALETAGISAQTPDPPDGRIERDADGNPTGVLHEGAMDLVARIVPAAGPTEMMAGLLEAQAYLHSLGITAWQDAILGSYANIRDASSTYVECLERGNLTARVVGALWWERGRGREQIAELVERREAFRRDGFAPTSVKIMQDGIVENFTAGMLEPYLGPDGHPTANAGLSMVAPDELRAAVVELDALGFQAHVHAIGDRAVREALDAFQAAREANGSNDNRHHIAHIQVIHPHDQPRFAELRVTGTMQPLWATHEDQMDDLTMPFLGPERSGWQYPFASIRRYGGRLAGGSDWPVSSPDPLWGIHVAVNRQLPAVAGEVREPFLPHEAISVEEALAAYTSGSAFVNHLDDTGRIEPGYLADLAVLDTDITVCPPDQIGGTQIVGTYVSGVSVFCLA